MAVVQPFVTNMKLPKTKDGATDLRYFAVDCFHFSQRGHALSEFFATKFEFWLSKVVFQWLTLFGTICCKKLTRSRLY